MTSVWTKHVYRHRHVRWIPTKRVNCVQIFSTAWCFSLAIVFVARMLSDWNNPIITSKRPKRRMSTGTLVKQKPSWLYFCFLTMKRSLYISSISRKWDICLQRRCRRAHDMIITSLFRQTTPQHRFGVIMTLLQRRVPAGDVSIIL